MCGIVGIFERSGRPVDRMLLGRMNDVQAHRGPNDGGLHLEAGIGLGHRRLSIIDVSAGHQPIFNEDGSVAVVFNGEIYNYQALIRELTDAGHVFRTRSDTEVIVHAWEEWGERCVERFRGMFAFAIWDRRQRLLFLARDRLGIKPLHYAELPGGTVLFGSELKALTLHPRLSRAIDPRSVEDYFAYGYIPDPRTIYRDVHKLPPGHTLTVGMGERPARISRYWDLTFKARTSLSEADAKAELVERLNDAVASHLVSEVPLGAFLSGGVDSSAVVAAMAGLQTDAVEACSIGFDRAAFDELSYAEAVAEQYGVRHHTQRVVTDDFALVDRLLDLYDEPFADSSALPTYRLCELARRHVTVALSGDGGDEMLAGYRRYRWHMHEERVRGMIGGSIRKPLFGLLGAVYPKLDWAPRPLRAKTTFQGLARDTIDAYFHTVSLLPDALRSKLYAPGLRRELQGYHASSVLRGHMENAPVDDGLSLVQYADVKTYLPGDILTKVDRASMAHSLEVRVPLLDHEFVEWAAGLPAELKLSGTQGKYVFKRALEPALPQDVLYRPKMGFAVPVADWFRGMLREQMRQAVASPVLADTGLLDPQVLGRLADEHVSGLRDHSAPLWAIVMFEGFMRRTVAASPAAVAAE